MSRRSVVWAVAVAALTVPAFGQIAVSNMNSFDLDNDVLAGFSALNHAFPAGPSIGNVPGVTPVVFGPGPGATINITANDSMFWTILPKEMMHSSNGTAPGTMEMVGQEVTLMHSFFGSGGGGSTPANFSDQTIHAVTYLNPISGAGPDGRRYPDLATAPILTILGGASGLPAPLGCAAPNFWVYTVGLEYGTAVPGSGVNLAADGATDLAWCFWTEGGMGPLPADTTGCEVGGTWSLMTMLSATEKVPTSVTTGAATPAPTGVSRNPLNGRRSLIVANNFNSAPNTQMFRNWVGFREPTLQGRFQDVPLTLPTPQRGGGALWMDATALGGVFPGFRVLTTPLSAGSLVITVLSTDPINFSLFAQPGLAVTPTSNLILNPGDPFFFLLTPTLDGVTALNLAAVTGDYLYDKMAYDTPLILPVGPIGGTGINYSVQSFVVDISVSPPNVLSTNVFTGNVR